MRGRGNSDCRQVRETLIDFADGELDQEARRPIAEHLARCADCRRQLVLLQRSLHVARDLWRQAEYEPGAADDSSVVPAWLGRLGIAAALVALLLLVWTFGTWPFPPGRPDVRTSAERSESVQPQAIPAARSRSESAPPGEMEDIDAYIQREARRARLAAATQMLSQHPDLNEYQRRAEQYVLKVFAMEAQ